MRSYYVYILTNRYRTVFYTGITNDLPRRLREHLELKSGFTARYRVRCLVYFEEHHDVLQAIHREKLIKKWSRRKKMALVYMVNPSLRDLAPDVFEWVK